MRTSASKSGCTPTRLITKIKRPRPSRNASVCSQTRERRVLLRVEGSGSSESSSVVPAGQLSAKSSLESIKVMYSLFSVQTLCSLCLRGGSVIQPQRHRGHRGCTEKHLTQARWLSPCCQAEQGTA